MFRKILAVEILPKFVSKKLFFKWGILINFIQVVKQYWLFLSRAIVKLIFPPSVVWVSKPTNLRFSQSSNFKASVGHYDKKVGQWVLICHFLAFWRGQLPKSSCLLPTIVVTCHATNLTSQGFANFHWGKSGFGHPWTCQQPSHLCVLSLIWNDFIYMPGIANAQQRWETAQYQPPFSTGWGQFLVLNFEREAEICWVLWGDLKSSCHRYLSGGCVSK